MTAPEADAAAERTAGANPAGPPPKRSASGAVRVLVLLAVVALAAAALCVRELCVYHGLIDGAPWLADAARWLARLTWRDWMYAAGPAAVVAGLLLLVPALRRAPATHIATDADPPAWLTPQAVARAASARALRAEGVTDARTTATRRRLTVTVTVTAPDGRPGPDDSAVRDAAVRETVSALIAPLAAHLRPEPSTAVRIVRAAPAGVGRTGRVQ